MKKIALVLLSIILLTSCSARTEPHHNMGHENNTQLDQWGEKLVQREHICFDFFKKEMITAQGGIRTNYLDKEHNPNLATGSDVLSESMGLNMLYAIQIDDKAMFESSLDFVKEYLDTGKIISYRYSTEDSPYYVNAFVDDIRIIRALILADEKYNREYSDIVKKYSKRLYDTNIKDNYILDMYDEINCNNNDFITLCYIDLYTIGLLEKYDARWEKVYNAMDDILKEGYISDDFPMYKSSYSYTSQDYRVGDINMIESTLTALNLARVGKCPEKTVEYLKELINTGGIFAKYDNGGIKKSPTESTAIYAICSLIAKEVKDEQMYRMCIDKMMSFQVNDENSVVFGAFADPVTLALYSFDNLTALIAYSQR